jgi:hypothetical protein
MRINEYRRYAAECLWIADDITNPENKMLLLAMAQAWLKLAQRAEQDPSAPQEERNRSPQLLPGGQHDISRPRPHQEPR